MPSRLTRLTLGGGVGALLALALVVGHHPEAQEPRDEEEPPVTEAELELYIDIYSAMQADHDLTIDAAVAEHDLSVEQFRNIERRLQPQERLVQRVREALLEQAKSRAGSLSPPTARSQQAPPPEP